MTEVNDPFSRIQLWGGVECTVNRVRDRYFEQLERCGHTRRLEDLDRFAALGIKALRQPLLWERACSKVGDEPHWQWTDTWLERLKRLQIRPIAGLVHHGSGPDGTDLLDPAFPEKLACFAQQVAQRYPWLDAYTPINEPLTTARFSALYGLWYPHRQDDPSFVRALLNQCRATVLAMRAIRDINPHTELIQTDDMGWTWSSPTLRYQADFDNERRWLAFDLLCGRVDRQHALWDYLIQFCHSEHDLLWFSDNPCEPSIVGLNHYLSSDRYIDERTHLFPDLFVGGNGQHRYIDTEAVRVWDARSTGVLRSLEQAWRRYEIPVAITECHNGCTREEQMRWIRDVWHEASWARSRGADVRAVTLWSLLGSFDWNTLVTTENNSYEPGVFDIRAPQPWRTALADTAMEVAAGREPAHPVMRSPGWWRRPERLTYGFSVKHDGTLVRRTASPPTHATAPKVLITGGTGTLGRAFAAACTLRGIPYRLTTRAELDIAAPDSVCEMFTATDPWAVVNTAGYVRVDEAESDSARCYRENTTGPILLARECAARGIPLVSFSSDLVFDGEKREPYVESDLANPLNTYGRSKRDAEEQMLELLPRSLIVRTGAFFGPIDQYNFVTVALRHLAAGRIFPALGDVLVSPTYVPDLVRTTLDLLIDGANGIWHLANQGAVTWADLAICAARICGYDPSLVRPSRLADLPLAAVRPTYSVLGSERAWMMPTLEHALERYRTERRELSDHASLAA